MLCQPFVKVRVIAVEQFQYASILAHDFGEEHLDFTLHRDAKWAIKLYTRLHKQPGSPWKWREGFVIRSSFSLRCKKRQKFFTLAFHLMFLAVVTRKNRAFVDGNTFNVPRL
jgi:hypothetical protein